MPSSVGHALVAVTVAAALLPPPRPRRFALLVATCAILPDIDAIGRPFGLPDLEFLGGHRALTHSLVFAAVLGAIVGFLCTRAPELRRVRVRACAVIAIAIATHGVLDAMTTYGAGVAFAAPFSWTRYTFGWTPLTGVWKEMLLLWLPTTCVLIWAPFARGVLTVAGATGRGG